MSNWNGAARSNYVRIKDMDGLKNALSPFPIRVYQNNDGLVCFLSEEEDTGSWPSFALVEVDHEDGWPSEDEIEFDPTVQICPFMEDDQILVMMEAGAEKLRYVSGHASAFNAKGDSCGVSLNDIYEKAAEKFSVPVGKITDASY